MFLGDAAITDFSALDSYNADLVTDYEDVFASVNTDAKLPSWYSKFVPSEKNEEQNNQTDTNETKKEDSTEVTEEKSEVEDGDQKDTNTDENQVTDKSTEAEPTHSVCSVECRSLLHTEMIQLQVGYSHAYSNMRHLYN